MGASFQRRAELLYTSAVAECKTAGVELSPLDYADLWMLAREAIETGHDGPPRLLAPDVIVAGEVALHAPTVGSLLWWETYGVPAYEGQPREEVIGLAWMLAHARDEEIFRRTTSRAAVRRAVNRWAWRLPWNVTPTDLAWGVTAVLGGRDLPTVARVREEPSSGQWGELVAHLAHEYHADPGVVAWQWPVGRIHDLARAANKRVSGEEILTESFLELRRYVSKLKKRGAEEAGHG